MQAESCIFVAGAHGMVGSALVRELTCGGFHNLLTPKRSELDLSNQQAVNAYLLTHRPDVVIISAAKVGGIHANSTYPADFLYDNLIIECNLIHGAHLADVPRLLFLGSTCIYPKKAPQPIAEEALLTSPLEATNEAYAIAKIAGVKLCYYYRQQYGRDYISAMPTNLYGPGDSYHSDNSHVIPGLMRRFYEAACAGDGQVTMWGSGQAMREFLYVDDLAKACLYLLKHYHDPLHINIGSEEEVTIYALAQKIAAVVGFRGEIVRDLSKPDGTPRKKSDTARIRALGWRPTLSLDQGLPLAFADFQKRISRECLQT